MHCQPPVATRSRVEWEELDLLVGCRFIAALSHIDYYILTSITIMDPTGGKDNNPVDSPMTVVGAFLTEYGWFLLIGIAIIAYLWQKYGAQWSRYQSTAGRLQMTMKKDDDANAVLSRQEAMLAARLRMQEEQNRLSAVAKEEMTKREEEKRQRQIEEWQRHKEGGGYHSKTHVPEDQSAPSTSRFNKPKPKKPLRMNDYSPLSGSGGGFNYRPSRRGCGGGGGGGGGG